MTGEGITPGCFVAATAIINDAISAHDFDKRERLVLDLVIKRSYGKNQLEAYIPQFGRGQYGYFAAALRISYGNAGAIVKGLIRKKVIEQPQADFYAFLLPVDNWGAATRIEEVSVMQQMDLMERPACLRSAMRETFVEQCGRSLESGCLALGKDGNRTAVIHAPGMSTRAETLVPVPDSGTGASCPNSYPIRVPVATLQEARGDAAVSKAVPDSGTNLALHNVKATSSHLYKATSSRETVPDSGTNLRMQPCRNAFAKKGERLDPERQEILDSLQAAGAFLSIDPTTGKKDPEGSKNCWLSMVRARPHICKELLFELRDSVTKYGVKDSPGSWMMDKWIRWGRPNDT